MIKLALSSNWSRIWRLRMVAWTYNVMFTDEMPPRGGFIPAETLVLDGLGFRRSVLGFLQR